MNKVDIPTIAQTFNELSKKYEKLGYNISQALELLLKENNIPYLSISYRTKDTDSFIGKIQRKNYLDPFNEIEDICGLRIICYYQSDIEKIKQIIRKEFDHTFDENKVENLDFDQFGYRSHHFVIKIKKNWLNTPNYRGLENLKAELQIRTVLMHAWAEIEHKLAYKSESQIPKDFRRKLSRISAKLEESDEQFEEIKNQIEINKNNLLESAKETKTFNHNIDFNLDSLQAFLDYAFGNRKKDIKSTSGLFDEMKKQNLSLKILAEGYEKVKDILDEIEKEEFSSFKEPLKPGQYIWGQSGIARTVLELVDDGYFESRKPVYDIGVIEKYRKKLKKEK